MQSIGEPPITIRRAYPDDARALRRLAALDSSVVPAEPLLVAEVEGELRVAVSTADLHAIADPFFRTAHIVALVRGHIERGAEGPITRRRFFGRPALLTGLHGA
ncbi:MAG: hypothetical protein ACJ764_13575 [Solirubrobacteraceae bacterium]